MSPRGYDTFWRISAKISLMCFQSFYTSVWGGGFMNSAKYSIVQNWGNVMAEVCDRSVFVRYTIHY